MDAAALLGARDAVSSDDYAAAGVPMLPVVRGEDETRRQIFLYSLVLFATTLLLYPIGRMGPVYLATAIVLGGAFVCRALRLWREPSPARAWGLFKYSIVYLAALFGRCGRRSDPARSLGRLSRYELGAASSSSSTLRRRRRGSRRRSHQRIDPAGGVGDVGVGQPEARSRPPSAPVRPPCSDTARRTRPIHALAAAASSRVVDAEELDATIAVLRPRPVRSAGCSWRHGPHHVAQKFTTVT